MALLFIMQNIYIVLSHLVLMFKIKYHLPCCKCLIFVSVHFNYIMNAYWCLS